METTIRKSSLTIFAAVTLLFFGSVANTAMACKSTAYDEKDAKEFCSKQLNCPVGDVVCKGTVRRWICTCAKPKDAMKGKIRPKTSSDYSINKNMDKASPKLLKKY